VEGQKAVERNPRLIRSSRSTKRKAGQGNYRDRDATAEGLKKVAEAITVNGGMEAVQLRVAEKTVEQFGHLAKATNTLILPSNFGDMSSIIATAMSVVKHVEPKVKAQ
jgi:hypothetical protein